MSGKDLAYYLGLNYPVTLVKEDVGYSVAILDLPGCSTQGESLDEAMENIEDAKAGWLEVAMEQGYKIPEPSLGRKLSAPAGSDVETAEDEISEAVRVYDAVCKTQFYGQESPWRIINDALRAARRAERAKWGAAARKYRRIYKAARKVVKSWEEDGPGGCTSTIITCELKDALAALVGEEEVGSGEHTKP